MLHTRLTGIKRWEVDSAACSARAVMTDGTRAPTLDLYGIAEHIVQESVNAMHSVLEDYHREQERRRLQF